MKRLPRKIKKASKYVIPLSGEARPNVISFGVRILNRRNKWIPKAAKLIKAREMMKACNAMTIALQGIYSVNNNKLTTFNSFADWNYEWDILINKEGKDI